MPIKLIYGLFYAGVAELADAIDLGSIGTTVQVQVLSPAPYMANEKDVRHEKHVFTRFFVAMKLIFFYTKPKMTFTTFDGKTGVELSHMELIGIIRGFID